MTPKIIATDAATLVASMLALITIIDKLAAEVGSKGPSHKGPVGIEITSEEANALLDVLKLLRQMFESGISTEQTEATTDPGLPGGAFNAPGGNA